MSITPINDNTIGEEIPAGNAKSADPLPASSQGKKRVPGLFILLSLLLLSLLLPVGVAIGYGIQAYQTYTALHDEAHSGTQHLLNIKEMFPGIKTHPASLLDAQKLESAQEEFVLALFMFQAITKLLLPKTLKIACTTIN